MNVVYGDTLLRKKILERFIEKSENPNIPIIQGSIIPLGSSIDRWTSGYEGKGILSKEEISKIQVNLPIADSTQYFKYCEDKKLDFSNYDQTAADFIIKCITENPSVIKKLFVFIYLF